MNHAINSINSFLLKLEFNLEDLNEIKLFNHNIYKYYNKTLLHNIFKCKIRLIRDKECFLYQYHSNQK